MPLIKETKPNQTKPKNLNQVLTIAGVKIHYKKWVGKIKSDDKQP